MQDCTFDSTLRLLGPAHSIMLSYCLRHDITFEDLRGASRKQPLAAIRQDCMAEIYSKTGCSSKIIGRILNRDHTTVLHAIKASKARAGL